MVRNKRLRLKTLGACTLQVVLSKLRVGSETVSTPMGPRAVTSPGVEVLQGAVMQFVVWVETMIAGQSVAVRRVTVVERQCLANVPTELG